jgi:hypothetical protein
MMYPSPFNTGRFLMTLLVTGAVIVGVVWAVRSWSHHKDKTRRIYERREA